MNMNRLTSTSTEALAPAERGKICMKAMRKRQLSSHYFLYFFFNHGCINKNWILDSKMAAASLKIKLTFLDSGEVLQK